MDDVSTEIVPVAVGDSIIRVEVRDLGGRSKVSPLDRLHFTEVTNAVEAIAGEFRQSLERIKPQKASLQFGIEIALEAGNLTALICKGTGKANVTVSVEWSSIGQSGTT